jgi:DNA-binding XRE family transcriptional regulator
MQFSFIVMMPCIMPVRRKGCPLSMTDDDPANDRYLRVLGKRIRILRVVRELSQEELARRAGVTRNFVSAVERGAQGVDVVRLRKLAAALRADVTDLLADPDPASE